MSIAILPGSYDPMTVGHLDVVRRAAARFDEVVVAVMINPDKKYTLTMAQRAEVARLTVADIPHVRVVTYEGLLVDLFDRERADVIVKGVRNEVDLAYEEKMAAWNLAHNPRARTEFLEADATLREISSTAVRARMAGGESLAGYLHPKAAAYLVTEGVIKA